MAVPEGIRLIAEYWPAASAVQVVTIFSAESFDKVMELIFEWNDVFDIDAGTPVDVLSQMADVPGKASAGSSAAQESRLHFGAPSAIMAP